MINFEFLQDFVVTTERFKVRLQEIFGGEVDQTQFKASFQFHWNGPEEGKAVKAKIHEMELKLRFLRSDVVNAVQLLNAAFVQLKAQLVGYPAGQKHFVREKQLEFRQIYDDLKKFIDANLFRLSDVKRAIKGEVTAPVRIYGKSFEVNGRSE